MAKTRSTGLGSTSVADLRKELARRQRRGGTLIRKRDRLMAKVNALNAELAELGMSAGGSELGNGRTAGGVRFKNETTLNDALAAALKGKTLSIGEAMEAVQKAGYRTTSKTFRVMVNIALTKDPRFKRVERGMYTVK